MKNILKKISLVLLMLILLSGCTSKEEQKSFLMEDEAPTESVEGNDGDIYLDTSTYDMYKYMDGEWLKVGNITGEDYKDASVSINKDGFWVIDGKVTDIKADGKDGVNGKDGIDGKNGKDGVDGKDGIDGKDGKDGVDGKDGIDGKDGKDGVDGKDGIDGKDGKDGVDGKDGIDGKDGVDGKAATLTINEDGLWVINGIVTDVRAGTKLICKSVTEETKTLGEVASLRSDYNTTKFKPGDEYICEVKAGIKYNFFVLSTEGDKINLILTGNINSDGTLAETPLGKAESPNKYNLVEWISSEDYSLYNIDETSCGGIACVDEGPVTVLNFLNNATKDWNYISNLNETYRDESATSTAIRDPKFEDLHLTGKARLPKFSEIKDAGCGFTEKTCPAWLYGYLVSSKKPYNIPGMYGYLLMNSHANSAANLSWRVKYDGSLASYTIHKTLGARPVISVDKDDILTNIIK